MVLTQLQTRVVKEIVSIARRDRMKQGGHLKESMLADRIGTSRSPINVALRYLVDIGMASYDPNRGYFLRQDADKTLALAETLFEKSEEPLYLLIAQDRLTKRLADKVTETELMTRYKVSRSALRKTLARILEEGWVERQVGQGWRFLPMIDSVEAYEEGYLFRTVMEPAALLAFTFCPNPEEFADLKKRQTFIAEGGYESMTAIELFEANIEFHETLVKWSGNRFFIQSLRRVNQLRRLVEYNQARNRQLKKHQAQEHLTILEAIGRQDFLGAAALLREHLNGARQLKANPVSMFESGALDGEKQESQST